MKIFHSYFSSHIALPVIVACLCFVLASCHQVQIPGQFTQKDTAPKIYPDYVGVTIPVNITPLTFKMDSPSEEMVARLSYNGQEIICGGEDARPDIDEWHSLMEKASGHDITVEVYSKENGGWVLYQPFSITVSPDSIDPYISYRLISPSYVTYEELTINQRCLENYDERVIYDNMLCTTATDGQCINCHNYQQYNPDRMQFHARQNHGGTVIAYDGQVKKVNMKNDSILSAGVYPTWHPWLKLIVYSTNKTSQSFHTRDLNKIEVFDAGSDLIAFDIDKNEVTNIENDPDEMEVFPFWAPDGKMLYYCSAHFEYKDTVSKEVETIRRAKELKYNIYRKSFDPETRAFGHRELVFNADSLNKSATLPRISPDGKWLVFTLGEYGCFHIWHRDADLWMMNLQTREARNLEEVNSNNTESYHSWSSNGRWLVFSSRRYDGGYTRPFFAHVNKDGKGSKPFELPQPFPDYNRMSMKCFNIPEFMKGPVKVSPQSFADILRGSGEPPVKYVQQLRP